MDVTTGGILARVGVNRRYVTAGRLNDGPRLHSTKLTGVSLQVRSAVLRCLPVSPTLCVVVKQPFINVEEHVDRFVGRRTNTRDPLSLASDGRVDAVAWQRTFGGLRVSRGVYRFHTHEEADEWLWKMMARPTPV